MTRVMDWILCPTPHSDADDRKTRIETSKKKVDEATRELLKLSSEIVDKIKEENNK